MIVRTMLNALLVLQLGLVLLLAATMPEDLSATDIAELGERIMTLLELCQKKIAHSGDSISSPAPDPPDKEYSISTCRGPSQDQRRFRKSGKKSVTVTEPRVKRGKGTKRDAEEEPEKKDNAATKVAPKKRGRKAAATMADKKEEEEDTEKKPDAKKARKVTADKEGKKKTTDEVPEEMKAEAAPEVAVPEPEVSSSTR